MNHVFPYAELSHDASGASKSNLTQRTRFILWDSIRLDQTPDATLPNIEPETPSTPPNEDDEGRVAKPGDRVDDRRSEPSRVCCVIHRREPNHRSADEKASSDAVEFGAIGL
jgi:hypothetical protein